MLTGCAAPTVQPVTAETDIPPVDRYAALTFDDGPNKECTKDLLDGLKAREIAQLLQECELPAATSLSRCLTTD